METPNSPSIQHFRLNSPLHLQDWGLLEAFSEAQLRQLLELGALYHNGTRLFLSAPQDPGSLETLRTRPLQKDDILRVHRRPRRFFWRPEDVPSWIKLETENFLLINKVSGLPTHPTLDNAKENLLFHLQSQGYPEALVINRLDMGTDGLILMARNPEAQRSFQDQTQRHEVTKIYTALVQGHFPMLERLESWMEKSPRAPKRQWHEPRPQSDFCLTEVLSVHQLQAPLRESHGVETDFSLLTLRLVTGKTHQIRSQMQLWGHPIVGDVMYGSDFRWVGSQPSLHSGMDSWALRSTALGWSDSDVEYHFELPELGLEDLRAQTRIPSLDVEPQDFGSSVGPRSTRFPHNSLLKTQSRADLRVLEAPEPQSPKPQ